MSAFNFDKKDLIKRYPHLKKVISDYVEPDEFFTVNDDKNLEPIKISIPFIIEKNNEYWCWDDDIPKDIRFPEFDKIPGFGKDAKYQWWEVPEKPEELKLLEKQYPNVSEFWTHMRNNPQRYEASVNYIKFFHYHSRYGYWFYNNGKPTYIDGWHFRMLTTWRQGTFQSRDKKTGKKIKIPLPEYRDRSRRKFLFYKWCLVDTTDHTGKEYHKRTCFGYVYPKLRRDGATAEALTILLDTVNIAKDTYSSMIGNTDNTGKFTFKNKFIVAWRRQEVWLRPIHDGTDRPARELKNVHPASKKSQSYNQNEVGSWIDYADKANRDYYDHAEISGAILMDEEGKTVATDIYSGWDSVKPAMAPGGGTQILKHAFAMHPSTVEDMEKLGGDNYKRLADSSDYYDTDMNGQTVSGLRLLFIPAYDGLEGYIGRYGESLMENLTKEQQRFIQSEYGAKEFIYKTVEVLKSKKTEGAQVKLLRFKRQHPAEYKWCWLGNTSDNGFNKEKLSENIATIKTLGYESLVQTGNLFWEIEGALYSAEEYLATFENKNNTSIDYRAKVVFVPHPEGRFHRSYQVPPKVQNKRIWNDDIESFQPMYPGVVQCVSDAFAYYTQSQFKMTKKSNSRLSLGAGTAFLLRDERIDPDGKPYEEWTTHKFIMDYLFRPESSDEYCEEMLMMSVYCGALQYPEINMEEVWRHFTQRGYRGYLRHDIDGISGNPKDKPGFNSGAGNSTTKQKMFQHVRSYIEYHLVYDKEGKPKERCLRILEQFAEIESMEDMTYYDLFAAASGNLMGASNDFYKEEDLDEIDLYDIYG